MQAAIYGLEGLELTNGERSFFLDADPAAFILFQLPHAIFAVSIMTALLPALSSRWTGGDTDGFRVMMARGIRSTGFVLMPAALGYIALASPIVLLLLAHGVTTPADAEIVAKVLTFFSLGLFSF